MEGFWSMIAGEDHQRRKTIRNPIIQVFHSYVQKDFGENERNKGNQHRVELALLGFDCQVANRPHFGVLPLHVGYLFETGYYKEPEASPSRDLPRIEYMKKSKHISEDERGGFKVAKINLPLSD
jgi:hypothetical protein